MVCNYVETQLDGYKSQLHRDSSFDYNVLKVKRRCTEEHRQALKELEQYYRECVATYKAKKQNNDEFDKFYQRKNMMIYFRDKAIELCPNDDERLNIILDMTYGYKGNRQFCWDCIGELIIKRLKELEEEIVYTK